MEEKARVARGSDRQEKERQKGKMTARERVYFEPNLLKGRGIKKATSESKMVLVG
jgi:acetyl-CoA carboxylase carboxyltransferase component